MSWEEEFKVNKNYVAIRVERYVEPSAEEVARWRTARLAHENHIRIGLSNAPESIKPIIDLHHKGEYGYCGGCDGGPDDSGEWPCRTIELIADIYDPLV